MKKYSQKRTVDRLLAAFLVLGVCLVAVPALAQVMASLQKKDGTVITGKVRYKKLARTYIVQDQHGRSVDIAARDVVNKRVQQPPEWKQVQSLYRAARYDAAIPILKQLVADYEMLYWDVPAASMLGQCYIKKGQPEEAIRMFNSVRQKNPADAYSREFFRSYANALLDAKRYSEFRKVVEEAVAYGGREVGALAQIKRGDLDMRQGRYKDALIDGYLRTVLLYRDVKSVRPEALYKAYKCFNELGQNRYAENMRKKLVREFPNHAYTREISGN